MSAPASSYISFIWEVLYCLYIANLHKQRSDVLVNIFFCLKILEDEPYEGLSC